MKQPLHLILLVTAVLGLGSRAGASDRWETLRAINWVENPTNHTRYGSKGELGPYQFRSTTWRMHTSRPFRSATDRAAADEVAVTHYEWIRERLQAAGVAPSIFNIAMAWNCGVNAVINGRAPTVSYRYAERVSNLVEQMKREQAVTETPARNRAAAPAPVATAAPRFTLDPAAPSFVVAGQAPRYLVQIGEPEIAAVVRTEVAPAAEAPPLFLVATAPAPKSMFAVATSSVASPRFALID